MKNDKGHAQRRRIEREKMTVQFMIDIYCHAKHGGKGLCQDCPELSEYAAQRLDKCPFQEDKPACSQCTVHCYQPAMREKIRSVMRYSGPRMACRHPVLAVLHFIDSRRPWVSAEREK